MFLAPEEFESIDANQMGGLSNHVLYDIKLPVTIHAKERFVTFPFHLVLGLLSCLLLAVRHPSLWSPIPSFFPMASSLTGKTVELQRLQNFFSGGHLILFFFRASL